MMKRREEISLKGVLGLITIILVMLLIQVPAHGVMNCTNDYDCDGFFDSDEISSTGITLIDGHTTFKCGTPPYDCLDPSVPDLFVVLMPSVGYFPDNPLDFVKNGFGITIHGDILPVIGIDLNQRVTPSQKAVMLKVSTDTSISEPMGESIEGYPNLGVQGTVFTERIRNHVNSVCQGNSCYDCMSPGTDCTVSPTFGPVINVDEFIKKYIKHTAAHETAHMIGPLRTIKDKRIGRHYPSGTNVILDQSVYYTSKRGIVNWYLGTSFTQEDINSMRLNLN
jgi:hypothetical protein